MACLFNLTGFQGLLWHHYHVDEFLSEWGIWGLFISAFISSTLLPGGSEAMLLALALNGTDPAWLLLLVSTLGNTLGGMTSWLIGWWLARRYPLEQLEENKHQHAVERLRRWGSPVLLLSWLPVVGDPLCVAAGWLKINPWWSMCLIALGKGGRYAVLLLLI